MRARTTDAYLPAWCADRLCKVLAADRALETGLRWLEVLQTAGVIKRLLRQIPVPPVVIAGAVLRAIARHGCPADVSACMDAYADACVQVSNEVPSGDEQRGNKLRQREKKKSQVESNLSIGLLHFKQLYN